MKTFDEQIREVQTDRHRDEWWEAQKGIALGNDIYGRYLAWCNGYNGGAGKNDGEVFDRYCKEQKIRVYFWRRKALGETYFGERYEWNGEKWVVEK